jgi:hypothetical protein
MSGLSLGRELQAVISRLSVAATQAINHFLFEVIGLPSTHAEAIGVMGWRSGIVEGMTRMGRCKHQPTVRHVKMSGLWPLTLLMAHTFHANPIAMAHMSARATAYQVDSDFFLALLASSTIVE